MAISVWMRAFSSCLCVCVYEWECVCARALAHVYLCTSICILIKRSVANSIGYGYYSTHRKQLWEDMTHPRDVLVPALEALQECVQTHRNFDTTARRSPWILRCLYTCRRDEVNRQGVGKRSYTFARAVDFLLKTILNEKDVLWEQGHLHKKRRGNARIVWCVCVCFVCVCVCVCVS